MFLVTVLLYMVCETYIFFNRYATPTEKNLFLPTVLLMWCTGHKTFIGTRHPPENNCFYILIYHYYYGARDLEKFQSALYPTDKKLLLPAVLLLWGTGHGKIFMGTRNISIIIWASPIFLVMQYYYGARDLETIFRY